MCTHPRRYWTINETVKNDDSETYIEIICMGCSFSGYIYQQPTTQTDFLQTIDEKSVVWNNI